MNPSFPGLPRAGGSSPPLETFGTLRWGGKEAELLLDPLCSVISIHFPLQLPKAMAAMDSVSSSVWSPMCPSFPGEDTEAVLTTLASEERICSMCTYACALDAGNGDQVSQTRQTARQGEEEWEGPLAGVSAGSQSRRPDGALGRWSHSCTHKLGTKAWSPLLSAPHCALKQLANG